jgi:hypothetical protein
VRKYRPIKEVSKKSQGKLQPALKPAIRSAAKHPIRCWRIYIGRGGERVVCASKRKG